MYDTLVNYQSGARILDQSLTMQSRDQEEIFDTLTLRALDGAAIPNRRHACGYRSIAGIPSPEAISTCKTTSTTTCLPIR